MTETVIGPEGTALATLMGAPWIATGDRDYATELRYRLSRFAYLHCIGDDLVLESPVSSARIVLHDSRAVVLVHALRRPCHLDELRQLMPSAFSATAHRLLGLLVDAGLAVELPAGPTDEDPEPARRMWEFHDLLFHARTRRRSHDQAVGGTYRFVGRVPPPAPVVAVSGGGLPLPKPDLAQLERDDPPLAAVQEARRSIRDYAPEPISAQQLGEFLYRVGRIADYWHLPVVVPQGTAVVHYAPRPYPSAGAVYELELHCAVKACTGIDPGFYRYDPQGHALHLGSRPGDDLNQLFFDAGRSAGLAASRLQMLIVIGARIPRIAWKYESIAYSLVLKDVGVLFQTMYMAAAAMGLAPCALGYGDSELFCRLAGTNHYEETSVGEFLLGSAPHSVRDANPPNR